MAEIFFQNQGVSFKSVPRNRAQEASSTPIDDPHGIFPHIEKWAPTQSYVVRANRQSPFPDGAFRDPLEVFYDQQCVLGFVPLSEEKNSARAYVIGSVTGPYGAEEGEWHGMLLVARGVNQVPTFGELSSSEMQGFHILIGKSLNFLEERQGDKRNKAFVGFSFSPLESKRIMFVNHPDTGEQVQILFPRSPVQNLATIHGHVVCINPSTLKELPDSPREKFDNRMVKEPKLTELVEIVRKLVINPTLELYPDLSPEIENFDHTENDNQYPKGAMLIVSGKQLENPRFAQFIQDIHLQWNKVYDLIADVVVDKDLLHEGIVQMRDPKERKDKTEALLQAEGFINLSENTKIFIRLLSRLRDPSTIISPEMSLRDMAQKVESFILLGPAYNLLYYRADQLDKVVVAFVPRWLSGASPLESLGIFKDQKPVESEVFNSVKEHHLAIGKMFWDHLNQAS